MSEPAAGSPDDGAATPVWLVLCRVAVLVALAASGALYVQYLNPAQATFCGLDSGCEAVRRSGFSYFGTPLLSIPLVGVVAFGTVLWASFQPRESPWLRRLTYAGAAIAVALLAAQAFVLHAYCWLCVTADVSAVLAAAFAGRHAPRGAQPGLVQRDPLRPGAWLALAVLVTTLPMLWSAVRPAPPVPAGIRALYQPGKLNVVEFGDFECPFCRALHPVLKGVLARYPKEQVNFVRRHVPLEFHEQARPAARTAICAEEQGKGEELADRLVQVELSPENIRRAAVGVGVDTARLDACLATKTPDARIEADTATLEAAGRVGLPTTYIGGTRLLGAVPDIAIRDACERALAGDEDAGIPGPVFLALVALILGGTAWLGRSSRGTLRDGPNA